MKPKLIDEHKFARVIAELLIDPKDPENPHPEHNAYNWGLIDAERALRGVAVEVIKEHQPK
jgi:hypothetical protein